MAITSITELPREAKHLLGSSPEFTRKFVLVVTDGSGSAASYTAACACTHGSAHPEFSAAKCYSVEVAEASTEMELRVSITAVYKIPESGGNDLLPWLRPDVWRFHTQGVAVPALYYFDSNSNSTLKPMVNSAGDYIEGVKVDEAQQKVTIQSNRQAFPAALAAAVTNCVNGSTYLGFPQDCVKVQGISGEPVKEMVNNQEVSYWKITSELLCRQTSWNLLIPDVGYNFLQDGLLVPGSNGGIVRSRAFVVGPPPDFDKIASSNPVALDGNGGMKDPATGGLPEILVRRVYKRITMSTYFGTPPT